MQGIGIPHLIILLVILLVFFGPSRLPALGQSIGKAIKGFKEGMNELDADAKDVGPQQQIRTNADATKQAAEDKINTNKS